MEQAAGKVGESMEKAGRKVTKFDERAEKTEKKLSKWMKQKYELLLEARDRISPILSTIGSGLKRFTGRAWSITMQAKDFVTAPVRGILNLLSNPILQAGAVLGVSIGLKDTIDTFKDFEAAMSQVQAVSGASGSELSRLTDKAKEMGATTKFTAEESAEAFNYMAMAGWKTNDMLGGIEGILNLAAASGTDLATTSDIVTDALTAFGLKASDSSHFADVLAAASSNANTNVSMMGETFKYAGTMAGSLGYSIEDVSLMAGLMANAGLKASMAGTSMSTIFTRLAVDTNGARKAIEDLGIEFYDSRGNARELSEILVKLREKTKDFSDEEKTNLANTIAGAEAQKGLLAVLNETEENYNKLSQAVNNADGASKNMSDTMLDNLAGSFTLLQSAADGVKNTLGGRLAPYLRSFAEMVTEKLPDVEDAINRFMDSVDRKAAAFQKKIGEFTATDEWQNADFFGKVQIAWDEIIAEPFSEWWNGNGRQMVMDKAGEIGNTIGSGISAGLLMLLGIDVPESVNEGVSVGKAFAQGFSQGFDMKSVSGGLGKGLLNVTKNAGKLLPGGESADLSSLMSAALLAKTAGPILKTGKGAFDFGKTIFDTVKGSAQEGLLSKAIGSFSMADELARTGMASGSGLMGMAGKFGMALGSGATTSTGMALAGGGAAIGAVAGTASVVSGIKDIYKGLKSEDAEESRAYGESGAWKIGGAASGAIAGAAIGSIIPGIGTAVGGLIGFGVGGIAGWIKGDKTKKEYEEQVALSEAAAAKAEKVFEATGMSIKDVKFETEELNQAVNDANVSAGELGLMFEEAVNKKLKSSFGDISLSLAEIQQLADDLVLGDQAENVKKFAQASQDSEKSFASLKSQMGDLEKMDWKMGLGMEMSDDFITNYKEKVDSMVSGAKEYVENRHYESTIALDLLFDGNKGNQGMKTRLNELYADLQSQLDTTGAELNRVTEEALKDGVISHKRKIKFNIDGVEYKMDEASAISELQKKITEITDKVSQAQTEGKMEALKIRYSGAALDAESFASLQQELQTNMQSMTANLDEGLELSLANLNLQFPERDMNGAQAAEYEKLKQQLEDNYNAQLQEINLRVESFQLESIAETFGSELEGILPDIEGTTAEKLQAAMNNALTMNRDPKSWSADEIKQWFGLESLVPETQTAIGNVLKMTAQTIPQSLLPSLSETIQATMPNVAELIAGPEMQEPFMTAGDNYATSLTTSFGTSITSKSGEIRSAAEGAVNTAFAPTFNATANVNVTARYNLVNPFNPSSIVSTVAAAAGVGAHAAGGYVSGGAQLSWLAEEGYGEFVIPTNPSRRSRALELYEQAGKALGVGEHAAGGFVGGPSGLYTQNYEKGTGDMGYWEENAPSGQNTATEGYQAAVPQTKDAGGDAAPAVNVNINLQPEFVIQGTEGQDSDGIMQVIRKHMAELADELGGEIAENLTEIFSNMPLKEA
ncbi:MAG: phage tail tape measure protein [Lachnospiraceae bacterium]|nr:phage tail tape measure protein [Lachnospiraceae bacterium]